jgi:hypothetical protein
VNPEQVAKIIADGLREIMAQRLKQIAPQADPHELRLGIAPEPNPQVPGLAWVRDNAEGVANNLERRLYARFEAHVRSRTAGQ